MPPQIPNFSGDVSIDPQILDEHSRDRSIFSVSPRAVFYPRNYADISAVINHARENKISVSVRAGGTCMSGGSLDDGYILNLTRYMNKVTIDPISRKAEVETGAYFRDIEDAAAKYGLMFAPYPSSHRICGIGGMIGNNASGEQSVRHGATIDNVISIECVLPNGKVLKTRKKSISDLHKKESEIFSLFLKHGHELRKAQGKVTKIASGYRLDRVVRYGKFDLTPLFVGSQGTLGIITKATLKLVPIPKHHELVIICSKSLEDIPELLNIANKHNPECIETFDINTYNAAKLTMLSETEKVREFVSEDSKLCVLVQFSEKTKEATFERVRKFQKETSHLSVTTTHIKNEGIRNAFWMLRRGAYTEIQNLSKDDYKAVPCIEDIIVPVSNVAKLISGLEKILEGNKIEYGFHGHIGEGSLRIIPFFNLKDPKTPHNIISLMRDVFELVKSCHGNMCADHSDGIIRSPLLKEFYGDELFGVFEEIKNIFDPENILNPKKKIGGSEENIKKYLG